MRSQSPHCDAQLGADLGQPAMQLQATPTQVRLSRSTTKQDGGNNIHVGVEGCASEHRSCVLSAIVCVLQPVCWLDKAPTSSYTWVGPEAKRGASDLIGQWVCCCKGPAGCIGLAQPGLPSS